MITSLASSHNMAYAHVMIPFSLFRSLCGRARRCRAMTNLGSSAHGMRSSSVAILVVGGVSLHCANTNNSPTKMVMFIFLNIVWHRVYRKCGIVLFGGSILGIVCSRNRVFVCKKL